MRPISVLVNARIDSSRLKHKMIRSFGGTTLLDIALEKMNSLDFFEHRFLAVAETELKEIGRRYTNVEIMERKLESVAKGPHHPMITFEHYTRIPTKYFFVINACHAFLTVNTIRKAYDIFQETTYRSYISAAPTREWIFSPDGVALTHKDSNALQNTSHGEIFYKATHAFYIADRDYFTGSNGKLWTLEQNDPYLILMPVDEAFDVDTKYEFEFSDFLYKKLISKKK